MFLDSHQMILIEKSCNRKTLSYKAYKLYLFKLKIFKMTQMFTLSNGTNANNAKDSTALVVSFFFSFLDPRSSRRKSFKIRRKFDTVYFFMVSIVYVSVYVALYTSIKDLCVFWTKFVVLSFVFLSVITLTEI